MQNGYRNITDSFIFHRLLHCVHVLVIRYGSSVKYILTLITILLLKVNLHFEFKIPYNDL